MYRNTKECLVGALRLFKKGKTAADLEPKCTKSKVVVTNIKVIDFECERIDTDTADM